MKTYLTFAALLALTTAGASGAAVFKSGQAADVVLGQANFTASSASSGQPNRIYTPEGMAMDPTTGKVFVSDSENNRILRFSSAAAAQNGANPEAVIGQPNFTAYHVNQGGTVAADTLNFPSQICVDSSGRLWVADDSNNRVLCFYLASYLDNDPVADLVLGQPNFTTNSSGVTQAKMSSPFCVALGPNDTLWVADASNCRVLRFDQATQLSSGDNASAVLGQPDYTTNDSTTTAVGMSYTGQVYPDAAGRLWVADPDNQRILRFDAAATKANGAAADGVIGQADFTSFSHGLTASKFYYPYGVYLDSTGSLWVADYDNGRVLRFGSAASIATNGTANLVLGQANFTSANTTASATVIGGPSQISAGPSGSIFVADYDSNRVLRFSPSLPPQPLVTVTGSKAITTPKATLTLAGKATDANGTLSRVEVKVGSAPYKPATGTSSWTFAAKLAVGKNTVLVRAVDISTVTSPVVTVVITRK